MASNTYAQATPAVALASGGVTSVSKTFPSACTNGSKIVAAVGSEAEVTTHTVSDNVNAGNYIEDIGPKSTGVHSVASLHSKTNGSTSAAQVTATFDAATQHCTIQLYEITNAGGTPVFDSSAFNVSFGAMSVSLTTVAANCSVFSSFAGYPGPLSTNVDTGFTQDHVTAGFWVYKAAESNIDVGAAGSNTYTWNGYTTAANDGAVVFAAYAPPGGPAVQRDAPKQSPLLMSIGQIGKRALPRSNFVPSPAPYVPPIPPTLWPLLVKLERPIGRMQFIGTRTSSGFTPVTIGTPVATHSYTARVPQVQARVMPAQVTHTYTAQVPKFVGSLKPPQATHTYTALAPQVQARVMPAAALHTYTAQVPKVQARVMPAAAIHTYSGKVPNLITGSAVVPPSATHTYTARVPQVRAKLQPGLATHTYSAQLPKVQERVMPAQVMHSYAARTPQLQAKVMPAPATHTYTARLPKLQVRVMPGVVTHSYTAKLPLVVQGGQLTGDRRIVRISARGFGEVTMRARNFTVKLP